MYWGLSRRTLVASALLGGFAAPGAAQQKRPVVGVLWHAGSPEEEAPFRMPLREGFTNLGYVEGQNIWFEERYPNEDLERFQTFANELVALKPDVIVAVTIHAAQALKRATATIPIVFLPPPDPVAVGLVASLARPGGNATGISSMAIDLVAKRVHLLRQAVPNLKRLALLVNPTLAYPREWLIRETTPVAVGLGMAVEPFDVRVAAEIEPAFAKIAQHRFDAAIVAQDAMFFAEKRRVAQAALAHKVPTLAPADIFTEDGALLSYGPSWPPLFRRVAWYVDRILKGAKPGDLPVEQPTVFELVINLSTAKTLGLELPPSLLTFADRLIE